MKRPTLRFCGLVCAQGISPEAKDDVMEINTVENIYLILDELRALLTQFRSSSFYTSNLSFYRSLIPNIEIVIALVDKGITDHRPITEEEKFWFKGDRMISEAFNLRDGEAFFGIYQHYNAICQFAYQMNYFRKN